MANPEHVEVVRKGAKAIAEWRARNPGVRFDLASTVFVDASLSGADLGDADLRGAYLIEANLNRASFRRANLRCANLVHANLVDANFADANFHGANLGLASLERTDLRGAMLADANLTDSNLNGAHLGGSNLVRANFERASLSSVNLTNARLLDANLINADLSGANLRGARVGRTRFQGNLSEVMGLDETKSSEPSVIGAEALQNLPSPFPEKFLRDAGLSDGLIDWARAQQGAIQFYSCFISYTEKNEEFAKQLYNALQGEGVRCWFAPEDASTGDRLHKTIGEAIRAHEKLVLILSAESIESDWVEDEVSRALQKEEATGKDALFPIMIDNAVMECKFGWAKRIREVHKPHGRLVADFRKWKDHDAFQAAFERLLRDLQVGKTRSIP